jgi:hypothetical protein
VSGILGITLRPPRAQAVPSELFAVPSAAASPSVTGEGGKEAGSIVDGGAGKVDGRGFISMEASNYGNAAHQAYLQWRAVTASDGNSDSGSDSCSDVEEGPDFG